MTTPEMISFCGLVLAIVGLYVVIKVDIATLKKDVINCRDKCGDLPQLFLDVKGLMVYQGIVQKVIEPHLAKVLHSPIHVERDRLVDKLIVGNINLKEANELGVLLEQAIEEEENPDKRLAAAFLLARVQSRITIEKHLEEPHK